MVTVLADRRLYAFIGGEPPTLQVLRERYEHQVVGHSEDGSETWLNWIVRLRPGGEAIGFVQATVTRAGEDRSADVAWVIGVPWQGRGYAGEAAQALVASPEWPASEPSPRTSIPITWRRRRWPAAVGLEPTEEIEDGERVWRRAIPG